MPKKADIYHEDSVPPLARRRASNRRPPAPKKEDMGGRKVSTPRFVKTPDERVPFDGFHPDGPLPNRQRRRRRRSPKNESKVGMFVAIGLLAILLFYGTFWAVFEFHWKKKAVTNAVNAQLVEDEQVETAPEITPAPVNVFELIQNVQRTERLMELASRLSEQEDYAGAIKQLNSALENLPNHVDANLQLARNHYMAKEYDNAITTLHHLLSEEPDKLSARLLLGQALGKSGRLNEAIEMAKWSLEQDPYLTEAHILAAMSFKASGGTLDSIFHLRKAFNMKPDDAFVGNELALAYAETKNLKRALEVFNSLMAKPHVDSVTYYNLATCYAMNNMAEEVVSTLLEASERFGRSYVDSWVRNEIFDGVRDDPDFAEAFLTTPTSPNINFPTSS